MQRDTLIERFFTALISGKRAAAREVIDELLSADCAAERIIDRLIWPTLEQIQTLFRNDQMSNIAHHYATRLLRGIVDQMQLRLTRRESNGEIALVISGPEEAEELSAQMVSDLLEADGYDVYFAGGGVANDEIVAQVGELNVDRLVIFGAVPSTVPFTRVLIDQLHEMGVCPKMQIIVGGGVFNRADGLAEEIGADLWAKSPEDVVALMREEPERRMTADQRTVGRKRKPGKSEAA